MLQMQLDEESQLALAGIPHLTYLLLVRVRASLRAVFKAS